MEFDDSSNVLGSFVGDDVGGDLEEGFAIIFLEGDFLIKDELIEIVGLDIGSEGVTFDVEGHFAGELDFHCDGLYVEGEGGNFDFLLSHRRIFE